jgi:hypothetical protein
MLVEMPTAHSTAPTTFTNVLYVVNSVEWEGIIYVDDPTDQGGNYMFLADDIIWFARPVQPRLDTYTLDIHYKKQMLKSFS